MAERKSFLLYLDTKPQWDMLSDQQAAALIRALFNYTQSGEQLETDDGMLAMAFSFMAQQIDRDAAKYSKRCERNAENARKRWDTKQANECNRMQSDANDADTDTDTDTDTDKESDIAAHNRITSQDSEAPSVEEVAAYCRKRENGIDPRRFVEHYAAVGWMQGNTPISDWKALIRKWETMPQHSRDKPIKASVPPDSGSSIDPADLERLMRSGGAA